MNAARPFAATRLASFLSKRVLELRPKKTQAEIAAQAGYPNPNMITMLKQGSNRVALDRVSALARALECDPAHLMLLTLEQWLGSTAAQELVKIFGTPVTANEVEWLEAIRVASDRSDPPLTKRALAVLRGFFGK